MSKVMFLVEDVPEGGDTARALRVAIFTEAKTMDELRNMVRDAVTRHSREADARTSSDCTVCANNSLCAKNSFILGSVQTFTD